MDTSNLFEIAHQMSCLQRDLLRAGIDTPLWDLLHGEESLEMLSTAADESEGVWL